MCETLEKKFPCRSSIIKSLKELVGDCDEAFPEAVYVFGHSGTGKTAVTKEFLNQSLINSRGCINVAYLNCVECYTTKILLENVLDELLATNVNPEASKCDNLKEFIEQLQQFQNISSGILIALDNAERLRDMDVNVLPTLLQLQRLTGLNISVILISQIPFEKFYCRTGLTDVIAIHFPQYTKHETLQILGGDLESTKQVVRNHLRKLLGAEQQQELKNKLEIVNGMTEEFFYNYLNLFLSVFYKACRDLPELKITARKYFITYMEPVLDGSVDANDVSRLWRHIATPLRAALSQVYMRIDNGNLNQTQFAVTTKEDGNTMVQDQSIRKMALELELPYYGKYLLIAAFLASHNSAKQDKRLFIKNHGKQKKRAQSMATKAKVTEKLSTSLGPKSFTVDRLLAIFYAILDEKVGLTCNLLSQISTLVHLKLLSYTSGESNVMDGGTARLQCTIGLEFVVYIGKVVGFNVREYLCDFM